MKDINLKDFVSMLSSDGLSLIDDVRAAILDRIDKGEPIVANPDAFRRHVELEMSAHKCAADLFAKPGTTGSITFRDNDEAIIFDRYLRHSLEHIAKYVIRLEDLV